MDRYLCLVGESNGSSSRIFRKFGKWIVTRCNDSRLPEVSGISSLGQPTRAFPPAFLFRLLSAPSSVSYLIWPPPPCTFSPTFTSIIIILHLSFILHSSLLLSLLSFPLRSIVINYNCVEFTGSESALTKLGHKCCLRHLKVSTVLQYFWCLEPSCMPWFSVIWVGCSIISWTQCN